MMVEFIALVTVVGCLLAVVITPGCWRGFAWIVGVIGGPSWRERVLLFELRYRLAILRDLVAAISDVERRSEELKSGR